MIGVGKVVETYAIVNLPEGDVQLSKGGTLGISVSANLAFS